jgi:hypothetical protein
MFTKLTTQQLSMNWLLSLLLFSTYFHTSLSLLIHYSNGTTQFLPSLYSTLGIAPTTNQIFLNISVLSSADINSKKCTIYTNISQSFVIYSQFTTPDMNGCCTDTVFARDTALSKTVESYGAGGLLLEATEKVSK